MVFDWKTCLVFSLDQLKEKLIYYRFHDNSLVGTKRKDIYKALFNLLQNHEILFKDQNKVAFLKANFYLKLTNLALSNQGAYFKYYKEAILKKYLSVFFQNNIIK